jgi:hypothetical protein
MQATNTSPGVFLFSVNGTATVGFPDMTPGIPARGQSWTATVLPFTSSHRPPSALIPTP